MTEGRKFKVLLVDDNKNYLKALKLQLKDSLAERLDYIDEVFDGQQALSQIRNKPYHVIFMDINMPGLNGIETTRYINSHYPDIYIVALSMHNEIHFIERMISAGSRTFISKDKLDEEAIDKVFLSVENNQ